MTHPDHVAVVGSGVAGLLAAHVLARRSRVTLYEADTRLGGHADTHVVEHAGEEFAIDTGFIVHNLRTYPHLLRLFDELGVGTQDSEMSMSVRADEAIDRFGGLEYAGALGGSGLFPTWRNALRPSYLRMLTEIPRFHRMAKRVVSTPLDHQPTPLDHQPTPLDHQPTPLDHQPTPLDHQPTPLDHQPTPLDHQAVDQTLGDFLEEGHFSPLFRTHFMESLVACVWSCDPAVALEYPARYLFRFLEHHGMLGISGSPQWRTVTGGSREYVARVAERLVDAGHDVRTGTKVTSVLETPDGVEITDGNGQVDRYDAVVLATHPQQALAMLAEPTPAQAEVLAAMPYSANTAQLHTDTSVLPRLPRARASWNYLRRVSTSSTTEKGAGPVTVTYDLTRLQRLPVPPDGTRFLVTLGGQDIVDQSKVLDTMEYEHPVYTPQSVAAQRRLPECDTSRVVFAGAWNGWGFHEDGARSGVEAARRLGVEWSLPGDDTTHAPLPIEPTTYAGTIRHIRRTPFERTFTHEQRTWLVDLDHLPEHGALKHLKGSFEARDHLGDPDRTIKDNVEHFLSANDVETDGGRIVMAANARAFGYCFNPISVFWCHRRSGELAGVVVEVHNTYGDRHAYLVHPDEQGRARTEKQMYVSPFHGTDGYYEIAVPRPGERLHVSVTLHSSDGRSEDGAVFSASLDGTATTISPWRSAPAALRGALLIRAHGIWLWARRLGIRPRPHHPRQEGV